MGQSILIVDDNTDLLELLGDTLSRKGYEVQTADCGKAGLAALEKSRAPDLILLDYEMPDMNGAEFLDQIEQNKSLAHTAVVYFTAGERPKDSRVQGYLNKMSSLNDCLHSIGKLLMPEGLNRG